MPSGKVQEIKKSKAEKAPEVSPFVPLGGGARAMPAAMGVVVAMPEGVVYVPEARIEKDFDGTYQVIRK